MHNVFWKLVQSSVRMTHDALIGFAPIVQPSPVRIHYLERVIAEMNRLLEGMEMQIADTFDLWTIHLIVLNGADAMHSSWKN